MKKCKFCGKDNHRASDYCSNTCTYKSANEVIYPKKQELEK